MPTSLGTPLASFSVSQGVYSFLLGATISILFLPLHFYSMVSISKLIIEYFIWIERSKE